MCWFQAYWPVDVDTSKNTQMMVPHNCLELGVGATIPIARGKGIGQALTDVGLMDVRESGYRYVVTDWRMTNIQSSSFWPKQGFKETAYRLIRKVEPRISWANGKE
jgi:ribosomal protein S18 acetylase RimI-like enzyme